MTEKMINLRIKRITELDEQIGQLKKQRDRDVEEIKAYMGDVEEIRTNKYHITWKTILSRRLDTTEFKRVHPKLYDKFCNMKESRRFLYSMI